MNQGKILVADDSELIRENLAHLLRESGYKVKTVCDGQEGIGAFKADKYDLVITDLRMPKVNGMDFLKFIKEANSENVVIMITGHGSTSIAVEAIKRGAYDYIEKPIKDDEFVKITVNRAMSFVKTREENISLKEYAKIYDHMIGYSDCMKKVFDTIDKVSSSDSTVLICGESGTGKELVARAIHNKSNRKNREIVTVNCGAIPEDLLESELFGHEKGAFTGAIRARTGRFELAHGGTIFLDEIGDMSPALQVKLLRVIQEKQIERIGGVKTINVDVRILTATHQNLEKAVAEKRFREDLYYRINVIPVFLPPLRERGSDIAILAKHFLKNFNILKRKNLKGISPEAINYLINYSWPGNVRELQNLIEMLVVMKDDEEISVDDLPPKIICMQKVVEANPGIELTEQGIDFNDRIAQMEKELLIKALKMSGGVKNKAARLLNLNRTTLVEKLKRLNVADGWVD